MNIIDLSSSEENPPSLPKPKTKKQKRAAKIAAAHKAAKEAQENGEQELEIPDPDHPSQRTAKLTSYGIKSLSSYLLTENLSTLCVYVYCRCSKTTQDLKTSKESATRETRRLGVIVIKCFGEHAKGSDLTQKTRPELFAAVNAAALRKIPLVVTCVSRLLRNTNFHPYKHSELKPTRQEFECLMKIVKDVQILTLNDPDSSPPEDECFIRDLVKALGGKRKGNKPKNVMEKLDNKGERSTDQNPYVQTILKGELSTRQAAFEINRCGDVRVDHTTVHMWRKQLGVYL